MKLEPTRSHQSRRTTGTTSAHDDRSRRDQEVASRRRVCVRGAQRPGERLGQSVASRQPVPRRVELQGWHTPSVKLPAARSGAPLLIKNRELDFSFHAMRRTNRRWGMHSMLYAADPWAVIGGSITEQVTNSADREAASSWVRQAREYFSAAEHASTVEPRPLLYYYSFLNLGKAIAIARRRPDMVGKVMHGVAAIDRHGHMPSTAELVIQASAADRSRVQVVDELHRALERTPVAAGDYPVRDLVAQSVVAHRMWREGFPTLRKERFITVEKVRLFHDDATHEVWARIYVRRDTLLARGRGLTETLRESTLEPNFRAVVDPDPDTARVFHTLEQATPTTYTGRAADVVMDLVALLRSSLWETVTSAYPYRRFYLYLSPPGEKRVPQWLSIYATLFWLGSLTRYQPVELLKTLEGPLGPFFREFLETQPSQLLYMFASEVRQQDVTKAAIV
jgi:hypothetical protein